MSEPFGHAGDEVSDSKSYDCAKESYCNFLAEFGSDTSTLFLEHRAEGHRAEGAGLGAAAFASSRFGAPNSVGCWAVGDEASEPGASKAQAR